jgi:hypothetical protein
VWSVYAHVPRGRSGRGVQNQVVLTQGSAGCRPIQNIRESDAPSRRYTGAHLYRSLQGRGEGQAAFERSHPSSLPALINLGVLQMWTGEAEAAAATFNHVIGYDAHDPVAIYNLATLSFNRRNYAEPEQRLLAGIASCQQTWACTRSLAWCTSRWGP